uniref:Uncharacterized protein n=1 Tax=Meloidogyne enterolobii TaxID=390850 RepID=A0A6V7X0G1_MELEN|nr:unnamed protein product [Meloidogyne enterolobii]
MKVLLPVSVNYAKMKFFDADEYDIIDAHINEYHKDKGEHEGQYLQHDQTIQLPGHGSHPESHNVNPENYVYDWGSLDYGSGSHSGGSNVYAPGSLDYGSGSHPGGSNVYASGSLDYGSGSHPGGSNVYAPGSLDYGSGSQYVDPRTNVYGSGFQQFGSTTHRGQGSHYHGIDFASPQEQHDFYLAQQASLNEYRPNQHFQIPGQQSTPANPPQQSAPRDSSKGKEKSYRKH